MTKTTSILTDELMSNARAYQEAKAKYDNDFRMFSSSVTPMAPEFFWPMVDKFRQVVLETMSYREERVAAAAADEFLRQAQFSPSSLKIDFAAAVHFALSWSHYSGLAYKNADKTKFSWDRGDDSYGDLMDAVVLMGQELNDKIVKFNSLKDFKEEVENVCVKSVSHIKYQYSDDPHGDRLSMAMRLRKMVLSGENYFASSLENESMRRIAIEAYEVANA